MEQTKSGILWLNEPVEDLSKDELIEALKWALSDRDMLIKQSEDERRALFALLRKVSD